MQCWGSLRFAWSRRTHLSHFLSDTPVLSAVHISVQRICCNSYVGGLFASSFQSQRRSTLCGLSDAAPSSSFQAAPEWVAEKVRRKLKRSEPEFVLKWKLDQCAKQGDLREALNLYDDARRRNIVLNLQHYNILLYLCSLAACSDQASLNGEEKKFSNFSLKKGFEIYQILMTENVAPDDATFTNVARLAVAADDPEMAFNLIHQMKACNIQPKLRSFEPALVGFCKKGLTDRAYEVDRLIIEAGLTPEEPELSALLKVSVDCNKPTKVYELLHRLRTTVRQVTESTSNIIADWFGSENASLVGDKNMNIAKMKKVATTRGGGWHGQGWLGTGKWRVVRTVVDDSGVCQSCKHRLVCVDINNKETEDFAASVRNLALQREKREDFCQFMEWLQHHGPFEAVIDGANVGMMNGKRFNFRGLDRIFNRLRDSSSSKRSPLIILHRNRVSEGPGRNPENKRIIDKWNRAGAFYVCPYGSNDDWYWLYAAVKHKCLLVTNDEMRDHIFQLLGSAFFPRWKEKHQIRLAFTENGVIRLHFPPPYSIVIQESESGNWHVPTVVGDDLVTPRQWICCTRSRDTIL